MEQGLFYGCRATAIRRTEQNRKISHVEMEEKATTRPLKTRKCVLICSINNRGWKIPGACLIAGSEMGRILTSLFLMMLIPVTAKLLQKEATIQPSEFSSVSHL